MLYESALDIIDQYAKKGIINKSMVNDILKALDTKSDYDFVRKYVKENYNIEV